MIEVDKIHCRHQRIRRRALRQREWRETTARDVIYAFQRGRCRAHDDNAVFLLRAKDGNVARRISKALLLLERLVMLFVDDDDAECRHRREHRESGADHNIGATRMRIQVSRHPRAAGHAAVLLDDMRVRKAQFHAPQKLRCEIYFRDQNQRLAAMGQRVGDDVQIHFGFATCGHACEQERLEGSTCGGDARDGVALFVVK